MTVGAIDDSSSAFKYVKHSISSMCTYPTLASTRSPYGSPTYLVDKYHPRHDFRNTLINVALHDLVHFFPKFIRHFCPPALDETAHDAHDILPTLRSRVRSVEVPEGDVLYELLAFVDVAFRKGDVGFGLEVVGRCVGV
jgi:hypothetical protein